MKNRGEHIETGVLDAFGTLLGKLMIYYCRFSYFGCL